MINSLVLLFLVLLSDQANAEYSKVANNGGALSVSAALGETPGVWNTGEHAELKNGVLTIPDVDVSDGFDGMLTYQVTMDIVPLSDPVSFTLTGAVRK